MKIEKTIINLLYHYDCVIIPGFGGFVAKRKSATFHPMDYRFEPPKKVVGFNHNLIHSDGLLANELVQNYAVNYKEACQHIAQCVSAWNATLNNNKNIEIHGLGTLQKSSFGIEFIPDENQNFALESFGLETVKGEYILREKNEIHHDVAPSGNRWISYAVAIAFALMIGASGFFANQELVQPQLSSVLPLFTVEKTQVNETVKPIAPVIDIDEMAEEDTHNQ